MTHSHTLAPHLSTYAAKAQGRARQPEGQTQSAIPAEPLPLAQQQRPELAPVIQPEYEHGGKVRSWKEKYKVGSTVNINNNQFIIFLHAKQF